MALKSFLKYEHKDSMVFSENHAITPCKFIAAAMSEPEASECGSSLIGVTQRFAMYKRLKRSHFVQAQSIVVDFRSGCFAV